MRLRIYKLELHTYIRELGDDIWPAPTLGFGYHANWFGSMLLSTLLKRHYHGPSLALYFFFRSRILELHIEWQPGIPPTIYGNREEMRASIKRPAKRKLSQGEH